MPNYHIEGVFLNHGLVDSYLDIIYAEDKTKAIEKAITKAGETTQWLEGPRLIHPDSPDYLKRIHHPKLPGFE